VRRLVCILALLCFALSLNASVPANSVSGFKRAEERPVEATLGSSPGNPSLALTAGPAGVSFYEEFYPSGVVRHEQQPKTGVLHWIASVIKKAVRR
jgi:hypothetical protein